MSRKLFFLRENPYFPAATLVELEDRSPLVLPDRGDGTSVILERSETIDCPPFAENVPPGQCSVKITSFFDGKADGGIDEIVLDESIHFQVLIVPLSVSSVVIYDRVRDTEVESYFPSPSEDVEYRIHIGHMRPGFYEAAITLSDATTARLTFIKFFPERFSESYPDVLRSSTKVQQENPKPAYLADGDYQPALLNKALELATEWGENYQKPIHDRIRRFYPDLSDAEIADLTNIATTAESRIYAIAEMELEGKISEFSIIDAVLVEFPWISEANAARLKNIGMYYARR